MSAWAAKVTPTAATTAKAILIILSSPPLAHQLAVSMPIALMQPDRQLFFDFVFSTFGFELRLPHPKRPSSACVIPRS